MKWDVFICHASEDKDTVARPLAKSLTDAGLRVWYDEHVLRIGDSLREKIDEGVSNSRFGIVILSAAFFEKTWPRRELSAIFATSISQTRRILPIRHELSPFDIAQRAPLIADILSASTEQGFLPLVEQIKEAIKATGSESKHSLPNANSGVKATTHGARTHGTNTRERHYIILTVTNLTDRPVVVTHAWLDCDPIVPALSIIRPLPVRLAPLDVWETPIPTIVIPPNAIDSALSLGRIRLSDGTVLNTVLDESVPRAGWLMNAMDLDDPLYNFSATRSCDFGELKRRYMANMSPGHQESLLARWMETPEVFFDEQDR